MSEPAFDVLLKRMEEIAAAVNAFTSETVQTQAFSALVGAVEADGIDPTFRGPRQSSAHEEIGVTTDLRSDGLPTDPKPKRRKVGAGGRSDIKIVKDLNLRPDGKVAFVDFIAQKQPKSNEEKYVVVVYYLEQIAGVTAITEGHVATVFRMTPSWREPENVPDGLRITAARKATLDTSDRGAIKTTAHGRNFVEHDPPAKKK